MLWHVIYTKPRNELKVAARLEGLGLEVYCPTTTQVRQWSDRKKKITVPLFSCYVFVKLDGSNRNTVFEVPGVVRFLFSLGAYALVKDSEIETIRQWNNQKEHSALVTEGLTKGDLVYIASGAFKSHEAIILELGKNQLKLLLPGLGFAVRVTSSIDLQMV